jgi:aminoglycoside 2'-N-acetyltransferase I
MVLRTIERLRPDEARALRALFEETWAREPEPFTDEDWEHTLGGVHFLLEERGFVAHAAVIPREVFVGDRPLATGYVEAVAVRPDLQRRGHGSTLMGAVHEHIEATFQLGALATGVGEFYEPLGWERWGGPTFVRTAVGPVATPEEDGNVFVRRTPATPELDLSLPITCDWRSGDVW